MICLTMVSAAFAQEAADQSSTVSQPDTEMLRQMRHNPFARKDFTNRIERETRLMGDSQFTPSSVSKDSAEFAETEVMNGVDTTFNGRLEDGYTRVEAIVVQPDGKILVGGSFNSVNGVRRFGLIRLNADSTNDVSFNSGNSGPNGSILTIKVLPDGKILIGGFFTTYNGASAVRIARLNSDGTLDLSFNSGSGANSNVYDIQVLADGRIMVAGTFLQYNGVTANRVARLSVNGSLDNSFTAPIINNSIYRMAIQSDGQILIGGIFSTVNGLTRNGVARLNTNGVQDTSFDPLTNTNTGTSTLAIQADGKIIVGSRADASQRTIVRLNPNGSIDTSFISAYPTTGFGSTLHSIIILPDGKILAGGFLNNGNDLGYGVVRFNTNGSLDTNFTIQLNVDDNGSFPEVFSIALTPGGKIVAGGDLYRYGSAPSKHIVQLNSNGTSDNSFTTDISGDGGARAVVRQTDGKIIVGGNFYQVNGTARNSIVRFNTDGSIDPTFNTSINNQVFALALQPDGKILVGGNFTLVNGVEALGGVRLNVDGSIDGSFLLPDDVSAQFIYSIAVQPNGQILAGGLIYTPRASLGYTHLYRVSSNGGEDTSFSLSTYRGPVYDISLTASGGIYIGGSFTNHANVTNASRIILLNANGTINSAFNVGTSANSTVYTVTQQPDGKVLIGGFFTSFNGQYAGNIARLNTNGSLDSTFNSGLGFNGGLYDLFLQSDNKILVGGSFSTFNGLARTGLARLNANGSLDNTFSDQSRGSVFSIIRQPDGKFLTGGFFNAVNGIERLGIARLSEADLTPPVNDNFAAATVITGTSGAIDGRTDNATAEVGEPPHAGFAANHSIWYKWRAPADGLYSFTTSGSSFNTVLAIYTGAAVNALTSIGSNDDAASFDLTSRVVFRAVANTDYYIAVDGRNNATGSVNLSWRQAARTYRFYAQTGNGNISPRIPIIIATRTSDGVQFTAQNISAGVYELDLPVDNASYQVMITGSDTWSPNTFTLNNSSLTGSRSEETETGVVTAPTAGEVFVTNAVTSAGSISGFLQGLTSTSGITVFLGSEGINPIAPRQCQVFLQNGTAAYTCTCIVDTLHQIKPTRTGSVFTPVNRQYATPVIGTNIPSEDTQFVSALAPTYNISGLVSAGGGAIPNATVNLTGSKTNSFITGADGMYQFNSLPAGGNYTITVTRPGYTFAPQTITNLQGNLTVNVAAQGGCSYAVSTPEITVPASGGGTQSFRVNTGSGCPWTVTNNTPWITINNGGGNGTGDVYFTVQQNTGAARSATLLVAGQAFTVVQAAGCTYSLSAPTVQNFPASGGTGSLTITPSDSGCAWTPTTSDYCMLSPGNGGTGTGTFTYTVTGNAGVARTATIQVGGQTATVTQAAAPGSHRTRTDFDGDGKADLSVYRPSNGAWYVLGSQNGFFGVQFGTANDKVAPADYDGDGKTDLAVFRPSNGTWYWLNSGSGNAFSVQPFGQSGDVPAAADFDGDGRAELAVYRPGSGTWYTLNLVTNQVTAVRFGSSEDVPLAADYDGDGKSDYAVYRPSAGAWYLLQTTLGFAGYQFGQAGDVPVPADYDGNGRTDIAVYRGGIWYRLENQTTFRYEIFGTTTDVPVAADYNGDRSADLAVFRPADAVWYVWGCRTNAQSSGTPFGLGSDRPLPRLFQP